MQQTDCPHWGTSVIGCLKGRMIYKDECIRCFHTPKSPGGLNVCFTCMQGSCAENCGGVSKTHTQMHYENSCSENDMHPIYMNIKMVKKAQDQLQAPAEITKVAIGMPGGFDAELDKYEHIFTVFCKACDKEFTLEDPKIKSFADSIMLAQSAFNEDTVKEWEAELVECPHTKTLDQSSATKIADKQLAHCGKCDLKSNLWLCMTCGHLGCGRSNYDGSGGNGHGLQHGTESHHPLVCKLGTITADGTASIHCYECDDDVLDKNLAEHLGNLGIEIANETKTEKSMAELNLEANLSMTLSKVLEEGKVLVPVFGSENTGMVNLGNTCYMNSVVQVLFSLPDFKDYYCARAVQHLENCKNFTATCYLCQFSKLALGLVQGEFSKPVLADKTEEQKDEPDQFYQEGVRPQMFKTLVGKGHPEFSTGQQQDALEYMSHLLDFMKKGEKRHKGHGDPTKAFEFEFEQISSCQTCQSYKKSQQKESLLNLAAPVDSKAPKGTFVDFEACLQGFFAGELIDDVQCNQCNARCTFYSKKRFLTYPKVMAVHLKRFVFDDWTPKKLDIELQYDPNGVFDFARFGGEIEVQGQPMPEMDEWVEPEVDMGSLNELLGMGVPENQAKHAVYNTAGQGAEMAAMWFYENIENPAIQTPLLVKKQGSSNQNSAAQKDAYDPEKVMMITSMGLSEQQAKRGLRKCNNDVERAIEFVFNHMDEADSEDEAAGQMEVDQVSQSLADPFECAEPQKGSYKLHGWVTHLGTSVHAGHYVAHIKKEGKVIYYNDGKVAETPDAPFGKGYIYFFVQV